MALTQRELKALSKQITILATASGVANMHGEEDLADAINTLAFKLDNKRKEQA